MIILAAGLLIYVFMMLVTAYVLGYLEGSGKMPRMDDGEAMILCAFWPITIVLAVLGACYKVMKFTRDNGRKG